MTLSARLQSIVSVISSICLIGPLVLGSAVFVASSI